MNIGTGRGAIWSVLSGFPFHNKVAPSIRYITIMSTIKELSQTGTSSSAPNDRPAKRPRTDKPKKSKKHRQQAIDPISAEGILLKDIKSLLKSRQIEEESSWNDMQAFYNRPRDTPVADHKVVEVTIEALSSVGDGIAIYRETEASPPRIVVVPYTLVGETVETKIYKTFKHYFESELVRVLVPSPLRNEDLVRCKYFGKCSGCQYQMVPYAEQLEIKRQVVVNAFKHYAPDLNARVPEILDTIGSPEQYAYRTKLTPHFDVPRSGLQSPPAIGFGMRGRKSVLDIEECSIGTQILNEGLSSERQRIHNSFSTFKRGATLLLRESETKETATCADSRICVTDTKEIITEYVGEFKFRYPASSFFQNNNSILPAVTSYVRDNVVLPSSGKPPRYLVDTYCGSGLFAITCSPAVEHVIGVEISKDSVTYAQKNAELNNLKNASFIVGQAEKIFEQVQDAPLETAIIIDPPRKGCDEKFLNQLLAFRPAKVVYVSCNVHSQARDIQYLLTSENSEKDGTKYVIESIRGFDFFPQTHHVESVAVLSLSC
jgi:tRNA (uracil-5-)-methyltransferase